MDDRELDLFAGETTESLGHRFDRALHVTLDDDAKFALRLLADALRELFERHLCAGRNETARSLRLALLRNFLSLLVVANDVDGIACVRNVGEAKDFDRR